MKFLFITFFIFLFTTNIFSLTKEDYLIEQLDLTDAKCEVKKEILHSSIQLNILYEYKTYKGIIPDLKNKETVNLLCPDDKGSIFYFEYQNAKDAASSLNFIQPLLWGGSSSSAMHPQRIYKFNNLIIVVSSSKKSQIDTAVINKLLFVNIPDETFISMKSKLACDIKNEIAVSCNIIDMFLKKQYLPASDQEFLFGKTILFNKKGESKVEYTALKLKTTEGNSFGVLEHITPDNDKEKLELENLIEMQKKGKKPTPSKRFQEFLDTEIVKKYKKKIKVKNDIVYLSSSNNNYQIRKIKEGYIFIIATEHLTGNPAPFELGIFYNPDK
jgi:hypothetical protein